MTPGCMPSRPPGRPCSTCVPPRAPGGAGPGRARPCAPARPCRSTSVRLLRAAAARQRCATSSPSRSTSRACVAASTARPACPTRGTTHRRSTSPTRTRSSAPTTTSRCPPGCRALDFELEVAVVIGAGGATLDPGQARERIFGYTIFNDWSARDLQRREMRVGLGPAKGKDFATTLGPWLVTADELEPYRDADGFLDLAMHGRRQRRRGRPRPAVEHGLDVRGDGGLRLPRLPRASPVTSSAPAPAATAAASRSSGAAAARRTRRRCSPATWSP